VGGEVVPTSWRGRFWNNEERGGMRVPLDGEVAWMLPEGAKPYWRGHQPDLVRVRAMIGGNVKAAFYCRVCRHLADSQAWLELLHDAADSG
jgi:hypothetical protein